MKNPCKMHAGEHEVGECKWSRGELPSVDECIDQADMEGNILFMPPQPVRAPQGGLLPSSGVVWGVLLSLPVWAVLIVVLARILS